MNPRATNREVITSKTSSDYLQADKQKDSYNSKIRDLMKNVYNFINYIQINADNFSTCIQSVLPVVQKIIDTAQERMIYPKILIAIMT